MIRCNSLLKSGKSSVERPYNLSGCFVARAEFDDTTVNRIEIQIGEKQIRQSNLTPTNQIAEQKLPTPIPFRTRLPSPLILLHDWQI